MKFGESGLVRHPLIEKAFDAGHAATTEGASLKAAADKVRHNMQVWYDQTLDYYKQGSFTPADLAFNKKGLDAQMADYLAGADGLARDILEDNFSILQLTPARDLMDYAENPAPHLIAATLLLPGVTGDDDIEKIRRDFGAETADIVHSIRHVADEPDAEFYDAEELAAMKAGPEDPETVLANIAAFSPEAKTVYLARTAAFLRHEVDTERARLRGNPQEKLELAIGRDETVFRIAQALMGDNPELDRRLRDAFNELASLASSKMRLSVDRVGDLVLKEEEEPVLQQVKPKEKPKNDPPSIEVIG